MNASLYTLRDNFLLAVMPLRVRKQRLNKQRLLHHQALHLIFPVSDYDRHHPLAHGVKRYPESTSACHFETRQGYS
jgi:hypothetical protein